MSNLDAELKAAHVWMRRPDNDEEINLEQLTEWLNERPVLMFARAAADIEDKRRKIERLYGVLKEIVDKDRTGFARAALANVARSALLSQVREDD